MKTLSDQQVNDMANVLRDGAYRICEEAIAKWLNPEYNLGDTVMAYERYQYWSEIKQNLPSKHNITECLRSLIVNSEVSKC